MDRIPISRPYLTAKEEKNLVEAYRSGWISSIGECIRGFEHGLGGLLHVDHGVAVSNGTTALHLALAVAGVKPGDEVIVPGLTFVASANAVAYCGATPVLVDISADTLCLDPSLIERAITPKTRAIIPVHLYGFPAPMDEINSIAKAHELFVLEDAAEALGASYKGKMAGSLGDCGAFSFYGNKIITTGEGGILTTNNAQFADRARHLRDHAMLPTRRYWHDEVGYNYRMTNLQAAIGMGQLENFEFIVGRRRSLLARYRKNLGDLDGLRLNRESSDAVVCPWFVCVDSERLEGDRRAQLARELEANGIDSRPYFFSLSVLPMYKAPGSCPVSEKISGQGMNLPLFPDLRDDQVDYICEVFRSAFIKLAR